MTNIKIHLARLFLLLSAISVLLTVMIPIGNFAIGQVIVKTYNGLYSVISLVICLSLFFILEKEIKEDIWVNRLKRLLSFSFLASLISNIFF